MLKVFFPHCFVLHFFFSFFCYCITDSVSVFFNTFNNSNSGNIVSEEKRGAATVWSCRPLGCGAPFPSIAAMCERVRACACVGSR